MIDAGQLRTYVVRPALKALALDSEAAENLILGTAAVESHMGKYLHQVGSGPARGIFQMEPMTHADIWGSYLRYQPVIAKQVLGMVPVMHITSDPVIRVDADALIASLYYATGMTRLHYLRVSAGLPAASDWRGHARYWKVHYNTPKGKGTEEKFLQACYACGLLDQPLH